MNFLRRFTFTSSPLLRTFTTTRAIMSKLYVGNLSWNTTDDTLKQTFEEFGTVTDSIIMRDRETGRARGFGFVTFSTEEEATAAVNALNEQEYVPHFTPALSQSIANRFFSSRLDGRRIRVNVANARPAGGSGFGGGRGGYGGGRGGGYGGGDRSYGGGDRSYGGGDRSYGGGDRGGY
ncbi:rna-binding domain-containing protein [Fusarium flagelliforme]|uniref:Rna-binding domain-containing protein n=1 Tax=Fusarium flagelliforme TaxID=2675880 RepID=A0A395M6C1_9HYPO|nr:rna-binding domain-containing protein [Fusarium flagelliforme]